MFKIVLLSLVLTGLQALPISRRLRKPHHSFPLGVQDGLSAPLAKGSKQGTEPSKRFIVDLNTGLVQDYMSEIDKKPGLLSSSLGNGHGEMDRRHWFTDDTVEEVPVQKNGGGWVRVEDRATLPDGFRQGTEPSLGIVEGFRQGTERFMPIPDGFRQGTEPLLRIQDGFRQGTEPSLGIPKGFRQGTERFMPIPDGFRQGTEPSLRIRDGFRQGTEPSLGIPKGFRQGTERFMPIPDGFRQGTEPSLKIPNGFRQGTEPTNPNNHKEVARSLNAEQVNTIPDGFRQGTEPSNRIPDGFRQGTERFMPILDGFRQGTEPSLGIPKGFQQGTERFMPLRDGFRQGTEPSISIQNGFRQGTEPSNRIPDGFRQGTERVMPILDGFRQGTEPSNRIPDGFRQGTERVMPILDGFRQGTEPSNRIPDGFRQGTEPTNPLGHKDVALLPAQPSNQILEGFRPGAGPFMPIRDGDTQDAQPSNHIQAISHVIETSKSRQVPNTAKCNGEIINGRCYAFNPTPMPFLEAQDSCKSLHGNAELASVTSKDLHSRLVSMVTNRGQRDPVMTWLGGMVENQQASWLDGSEWGYSDWMPGQPNIHADKPVCVEMFRMDETWWTAANCDLKKASICSYPVVA